MYILVSMYSEFYLHCLGVCLAELGFVTLLLDLYCCSLVTCATKPLVGNVGTVRTSNLRPGFYTAYDLESASYCSDCFMPQKQAAVIAHVRCKKAFSCKYIGKPFVHFSSYHILQQMLFCTSNLMVICEPYKFVLVPFLWTVAICN